MKKQILMAVVTFIPVFVTIHTCRLFSDSEDKTGGKGQDFFSIESIRKKYPNHNTLNSNIPQKIIKKLHLNEILEFDEIRMFFPGNDIIARFYSYKKGEEGFNLRVIITKSSFNAHNEALSLILTTSCQLYQIDSSNPYFLGDWCVINTQNDNGKDPPAIVIFSKNNITISAESNNKINTRFFWDKIVKINEKLSDLGEFVENPHELDMKVIEKDIDQLTPLKNNVSNPRRRLMKTYSLIITSIVLLAVLLIPLVAFSQTEEKTNNTTNDPLNAKKYLTRLTPEERKHYKYDEWKFSPFKAIVEIDENILGNVDKFELLDMGCSGTWGVAYFKMKEDGVEYLTKIIIISSDSEEELKGLMIGHLISKQAPFPYPIIEGIGDFAFGFKDGNIYFSRSNYVVRVHGNKDVWEIAKRIDEQIKKAPLLKEGEKPFIKMANKKFDKRKPHQEKINNSKKKFSSENWEKEKLTLKKGINILPSIFPKGDLKEREDSSPQYRNLRLEISNGKKGVKDKVNINIWIFPTIEEAEDKFLLLLEDWNVPPSARMENGPGRIAYSGGEEGIMFLYGNMIYESEDKGMDHLAVAKKVAEIIEKAPELKPGEKPGIIFNK